MKKIHNDNTNLLAIYLSTYKMNKVIPNPDSWKWEMTFPYLLFGNPRVCLSRILKNTF